MASADWVTSWTGRSVARMVVHASHRASTEPSTRPPTKPNTEARGQFPPRIAPLPIVPRPIAQFLGSLLLAWQRDVAEFESNAVIERFPARFVLLFRQIVFLVGKGELKAGVDLLECFAQFL